jgi:hypothetical protein
MKRRAVLTTVAAFVAVLVVGAAAGIAADRFIHGAFVSHWLTDEFRMSTGVTAAGNPDRARKFKLSREVINVPEHYGKLVTINEQGNRTVFWFQSTNGRVRNVIVEGTANDLFAVQMMSVKELRVDQHR